jgi:hypothetical protein
MFEWAETDAIFFYTYTPTVQNMATVPKPPSMLARIATVDSFATPFGRLDHKT